MKPVVRSSRDFLELWEGRTLLSRLRREPGPSHTPLDVLAAAVAALAPPGAAGVLGFGAGGIVAPLRALGRDDRVHAVDVAPEGFDLFARAARSWGGNVRFHEGDAATWLRRRRPASLAVTVDDLSCDLGGVPSKPWESIHPIPRLARRALSPRGVTIVNALPCPDAGWRVLVANLAWPFAQAAVVSCEGFENRIVVAADELPSARRIGRALRDALRRIDSREATRLRVRTWQW